MNTDHPSARSTLVPHYRHLKHLQYEHDSWKRVLGFIQEENTLLKNKLAEVLKEDTGNELLDALESFQGQFIKEDEMIRLLRNNLAESGKLLTREIYEDGMIIREVDHKANRLRHEMSVAERQFSKLRSAFIGFLAANI